VCTCVHRSKFSYMHKYLRLNCISKKTKGKRTLDVQYRSRKSLRHYAPGVSIRSGAHLPARVWELGGILLNGKKNTAASARVAFRFMHAFQVRNKEFKKLLKK
jgi:hypothetical protein